MSKTKTYTVKKGDTLSHIAQSQLGKASLWSEILKANSWLEEQNRYDKSNDHVLIKAGEKLVIPNIDNKADIQKEAKKGLVAKIKSALFG